MTPFAALPHSFSLLRLSSMIEGVAEAGDLQMTTWRPPTPPNEKSRNDAVILCHRRAQRETARPVAV